MRYNTRIAPSPTGDFHIGTARTAYFNWLAARSTQGRFILRIDDTDKERSKSEYVQIIVDSLRWLGLDYDDIIFQSDRFDRYKELAKNLIEVKKARFDDGAIVLDLSDRLGIPISWKDEITGIKAITVDDFDKMNGMVLIKSDGSPSYNFCSIVDDIDLGINYVIRGTDHITNTSKQVVLAYLLDVSKPIKFAHVGLICVKNKPLSKRDGDSSLLSYKERGVHPEAMLNFLARLGWGPKVDDKTTKLLPKDRMLELFFIGGHMRSQAANLDLIKLDSFDRKYQALERHAIGIT